MSIGCENKSRQHAASTASPPSEPKNPSASNPNNKKRGVFGDLDLEAFWERESDNLEAEAERIPAEMAAEKRARSAASSSASKAKRRKTLKADMASSSSSSSSAAASSSRRPAPSSHEQLDKQIQKALREFDRPGSMLVMGLYGPVAVADVSPEVVAAAERAIRPSRAQAASSARKAKRKRPCFHPERSPNAPGREL